MDVLSLFNGILSITCLSLLILFLIYWLVVPVLTAPFFISSIKDMLAMFELADLGPEDKVVDLGSGDGRVVLAASRVAKSAVGIEINPFLTLFSRFMAVMSANGKIKFKNKDMFKENLKKYNVVFIYLLPSSLEKLKQKLQTELEPGTRVVTHSFAIKGWEPKNTKKIENRTHYLYIID